MKNIIVIPDGLDRNQSVSENRISWIYQTVLDKVAADAKDEDVIYLAPANHFGQNITEHEAAYKYLKMIKPSLNILVPSNTYNEYLDTRHNAIYLKAYIQELNRWPLRNTVIYSYILHSYRAEIIFNQEDYNFSIVRVKKSEKVIPRPIVKRLWYYNQPAFHFLYELIAYFLFAFKFK